MGRRDRERVERIKDGLDDPIRHEQARNLIVDTIQRQPTDKQVGILEESLNNGRLQNSRLRQSLEQNAPIEMRKGIGKMVKKGKIPTVDLLLEEYRREKVFQKLAAGVGLDEAWFIKLAEDELAKSGVNDGGKTNQES